MNILPKKRWHVRTKENIARVRRDEAQAAEEEKEKERRIKLAEKEARRDFMRERARAAHGVQETAEHQEDEPSTKADHKLEHVNFFAEEEAGLVSSTAVNKEHEEEKKQETEKYEKQIGYLTYLGQDTNEATGKVSWYNKNPERDEPGLSSNEETGLKHKVLADPLHSFKKYCYSSFKKTSSLSSSSSKPSTSESITNTSLKRSRERSRSPEDRKKDKSHRQKKKKSKKHKKEKRHKNRTPDKDSEGSGCDDDAESVSDEDDGEKKAKLEKLRAERLRREREEKKRAEKLIAKINGVTYIDEDEKPQPKPVMKQRYNSQFNPDIAKQNYEDQRYRF
ncbi:hypothetical protein ONE63_006239 [Megalurothrips usitatus]|uniref:CBF1-interacting co-repressor CIR N-terminal domain-containing protein n=1 Tax=Megalurothrips usitatus TaxID=439358 RepID=A0AAV7XSR7_9NEOP|nr:hypothetical protein ONE63_006239 [Megalurothrips usitatus]